MNGSVVQFVTERPGPCSDFLRATINPGSIGYSFQRSPICTSYLDWYKDNICSWGPGSSLGVPLPPGVWNEHLWNSYTCCGGCNILDPPHVRILYWPPDTTSECGTSGTNAKNEESTRPTSISVGPSTGQGNAGQTVAILDGMTLYVYGSSSGGESGSDCCRTYPSLYLAFSGTLHVTDRCGFLGRNYTNPTIAVPSGALSTLSYSVPFIIQEGVTTGAFDPGMA